MLYQAEPHMNAFCGGHFMPEMSLKVGWHCGLLCSASSDAQSTPACLLPRLHRPVRFSGLLAAGDKSLFGDLPHSLSLIDNGMKTSSGEGKVGLPCLAGIRAPSVRCLRSC